MGKRSAFERVERDFYPTPREAVLPLLPHLNPGATYVEPCAGDGALIGHLKSAGMVGIGWDIEPQVSWVFCADALTFDFPQADYFITNPPWDRKILHPLIERLSSIAPTWLLFDADWPHTKQAARFMPRLRKIVSVGRIKWIPGSKMTGKDNCAWYLFDANTSGPVEFVGRASA